MSGGPEARLRVLVVDDESSAREVLCADLADRSDIEVVGQAANGLEAIRLAHELGPDVLLLDIQMPKVDGFETAELLRQPVAEGTGEGEPPPPEVVFVTAYDEHALEAFRVHALDYLLKPVETDRLLEALDRVRDIRSRRTGNVDGVGSQSAPQRLPGGGHTRRILVREGPRVHVVPVDDLLFVEASDDYVRLALADGELRKQQTLTDLEGSLDPDQFVRIHRSYLLNLDALARIELYAKDSRVVILRDGRRIPMSRSGYARLRERL